MITKDRHILTELRENQDKSLLTLNDYLYEAFINDRIENEVRRLSDTANPTFSTEH